MLTYIITKIPFAISPLIHLLDVIICSRGPQALQVVGSILK